MEDRDLAPQIFSSDMALIPLGATGGLAHSLPGGLALS